MKLEIFNAQQEYNSNLESFCDQNCVMQVLKYFEVKNPFSYFNTSLNMHLFKAEGTPVGYQMEFDNELLLPVYRGKIKKIHPIGKSNQEVWEENKARLREGIPVIAGIDVYYLNHSPHYRKLHSNHKCILCGYTEDERATIIDCYEWNYKDNVILEDFLEARASLCSKDDSPYSGFPIENIWLEVDERNWSVNVRDTLRETIDTTIRQYYENGLTGDRTDYYGMEALKKIYQLFLELRDLETAEKSKFISDMRAIFLFLYTRLKLFRYYLLESTKCVNQTILSVLLQTLDKDIVQWHKASMIMLKATVSLNDKSYERIVDKIKELIASEEKRYQPLINLRSIL